MIFNLPDLGEGLPDAEIATWYVKVRDWVEKDQNLVSLETAKALVDVPSPMAGRLVKLFGHRGDIIKTGEPLVEFEAEKKDTGTVAGRLEESNTVLKENTVHIMPAVRALATRLQVDLKSIKPTNPDGILTTKDVEEAAKKISAAGSLELLKGVRRTMAVSMSQSHTEVVSVTVVEDAKCINWSKTEDITIRLIQAIIFAAKKEPALNAWYDGKAIGRRLIDEINIGIAMDTADGLFVPVMHHADKADPITLRKRLDLLKTEVQSRKILPENLKGASFILSNFGKFSGRYANPIIMPPTVAILGAGSLREEVVVVNGKSTVCPVLPLSLTFDHRAVTGGEATRFLGAVIQCLENIN